MRNRRRLLHDPKKAMIDSHAHPEEWGVRPVLFHVGEFGVPAYSFFVLLGLVAGVSLYCFDARRNGRNRNNGAIIIFGAIAGGIIGAKALEWALNYQLLVAHFSEPAVWLSGRTIVGGLLGGKAGALLVKKAYGIREKRGNEIAPAVALGVLIGRFGCFFRGCCYGKPTGWQWGVNFGDGVLRHPAQLYEALFMFAMFLFLSYRQRTPGLRPGELFRLLMICYFTFRFLIEFIRVEPVVLAGLTSFQLISLAVILFFAGSSLFSNNFRENLHAGEL
ncbi:MAG: prolipoprotein diacylglyceryl transferase [Chlorobaculum sp.]|nr:prolipoprotein diacylglyceryl transferase [Chlorobaculum sp.]